LNPKEELQLIGIVNFKYPAMTRRSTFNKMGHYTAIVARPGNCWLEYDDLASSEKSVKKIYEINPHLLIYKS
jgi:hypothetical protein